MLNDRGQTERQKDGETGRLKDRKTERQEDGKTERRKERKKQDFRILCQSDQSQCSEPIRLPLLLCRKTSRRLRRLHIQVRTSRLIVKCIAFPIQVDFIMYPLKPDEHVHNSLQRVGSEAEPAGVETSDSAVLARSTFSYWYVTQSWILLGHGVPVISWNHKDGGVHSVH